MDMKVTCPSCGQHLVVDSAAIGQQTNCPTCLKPFVIPVIARVASSPITTTADTRRKDTAILSLFIGILSLPWIGIVSIVMSVVFLKLLPWLLPHLYICFFLSFSITVLPGVAAVILGHKAHGRARQLPSQFAGGGMAIAGFILGYVSITLILVMAAFSLIRNVELDSNHREAQVIESENNLKEIGMAFRIWEGDHNNQYPFNVSQAQGGTRELCEQDSDGFEKNPVPTFMVMSNELATTRILVCPNDKTKQAAADFASLTANNISYQLRTGTNVNDNNPGEILAVDPINGFVLHCDGSIERDFHYQKTVTNN